MSARVYVYFYRLDMKECPLISTRIKEKNKPHALFPPAIFRKDTSKRCHYKHEDREKVTSRQKGKRIEQKEN